MIRWSKKRFFGDRLVKKTLFGDVFSKKPFLDDVFSKKAFLDDVFSMHGRAISTMDIHGIPRISIFYLKIKNLHFSTPVHPFELIPVRFCVIFRGDSF